jgi:hypothetical protein
MTAVKNSRIIDLVMSEFEAQKTRKLEGIPELKSIPSVRERERMAHTKGSIDCSRRELESVYGAIM